MQKVEISVLMAAYNAEALIQESIESILSQTFDDFEFILIDDGSTDTTPDIMKSYKDKRIRMVSQENMGLARSLNKGLRMAKGRYIARLDADDIALPHRLERQYGFMESHPECVASGTSAMIMDINGKYLYTAEVPLAWHEIQAYLPYESPFFHSSVIFQTDPAVACGGYYEKIIHHFEDLVLWNNLTKYGELRNLPEPLIKYRLVPFAITNNSNRIKMNEIVKQVLQGGDISKEDLELFQSLSTKQGNQSKFSNYHLNVGWIYLLRANNRLAAVKNFILSIVHYPLNYRAWFFLFLCTMSGFNRNIISAWKRFRHIA
jgi:glycosyltransferase involved in cell wall biosynthesis